MQGLDKRFNEKYWSGSRFDLLATIPFGIEGQKDTH
jgi:hypothetical protein